MLNNNYFTDSNHVEYYIFLPAGFYSFTYYVMLKCTINNLQLVMQCSLFIPALIALTGEIY